MFYNRESSVSSGGNVRSADTAKVCGHDPRGLASQHITPYRVQRPFSFSVPEPPQQPCEEVDRADCFIPVSQVGKLSLEGAD